MGDAELLLIFYYISSFCDTQVHISLFSFFFTLLVIVSVQWLLFQLTKSVLGYLLQSNSGKFGQLKVSKVVASAVYRHCLHKKCICAFYNLCRASIFKVHLRVLKTLLNKDDLSRKIAALTPGFSGEYCCCDVLIFALIACSSCRHDRIFMCCVSCSYRVTERN